MSLQKTRTAVDSPCTEEGRAQFAVRVMFEVGRGLTMVGCVDHVAFRLPDRGLHDWRSRLAQYTDTLGPAEDHVYVRAVRIEGPEGVRLELVFEGPGVTVDEAPADLGTYLVLPPCLEAQRPYLDQRRPPLQHPGAVR